MATFIRFVDFASGDDTTGDGLAIATAWKTLQHFEDIMAGIVSPSDDITCLVVNGDDISSDQTIFFNDSNWRNCNVQILPATGEPRIKIVSSSYGIRMFAGDGTTHQCPNIALTDIDFDSTDYASFVNVLQSPSDDLIFDITINNCTAIFCTSLIQLPKDNTGSQITIRNTTVANLQTLIYSIGGIGDVECTGCSFNLTGASPRKVMMPNNVSPGVIGNWTFSGNTWAGVPSGAGVGILSGLHIIGAGGATLRMSDTWDFASVASDIGPRLFDIDDTNTDGGEFTIDLSGSNIRISSDGYLIRLGLSVDNSGYTNSQLPRAKTAEDSFNKLRFIANDALIENTSTGGGIVTQAGVISTLLQDTILLGPNSNEHLFNFWSNNVTLERCYCEGNVLAVLFYGDNMTLRDSFVKTNSTGGRPFIMGKSGGSQSEAAQGMTIVGNVIQCNSTNPDHSAFDDYGWQAANPYGPVWYGSEETPGGGGGGCGYHGWTVTDNTFIATSGAHAMHVGRLTDNGAGWESDHFDTFEEYETFLAGESGDGRTANTWARNYAMAWPLQYVDASDVRLAVDRGDRVLGTLDVDDEANLPSETKVTYPTVFGSSLQFTGRVHTPNGSGGSSNIHRIPSGLPFKFISNGDLFSPSGMR